jgi:DHA2 family multidrug resistance protein-like MFS transporter
MTVRLTHEFISSPASVAMTYVWYYPGHEAKGTAMPPQPYPAPSDASPVKPSDQPAPLPAIPPGDDDGLPTPRRYVAMATIFTSITLVVLDGAIANVALPTIATALHASPAASVWIVTSYQMAVVMALLPCAALGESLGFRPVYIAGIALFTLASATCAVSPSLEWLIVGRFLQGLGSAAIMSLGLAMLRFIYPKRLLGTAIGWNAVVVALPGAAGPSIGAAILSVAHWSWLFSVNIPIGILALVASRALPHVEGSRRRIDRLSALLNAGVFAALVVGVDKLASDVTIGLVLLAASTLLLIVLVRRELPRHAPLIPIDLLRVPSFRISVISSVFCFAGQTVSIVALPFYLEHTFHQSTGMTGIYMTPWPLAVAIAAPISGRMANKIATGILCAAGGVSLSIGLGVAAMWPLAIGPALLVPFTILSGLGFGFFQTPNNRNMLLSAPKARTGAAGGMQGTARLLGQTLGAVVMTVLFTLISTDTAPRVGLAVGAAFALAAGLISTLRIAEATPSPS